MGNWNVEMSNTYIHNQKIYFHLALKIFSFLDVWNNEMSTYIRWDRHRPNSEFAHCEDQGFLLWFHFERLCKLSNWILWLHLAKIWRNQNYNDIFIKATKIVMKVTPWNQISYKSKKTDQSIFTLSEEVVTILKHRLQFIISNES